MNISPLSRFLPELSRLTNCDDRYYCYLCTRAMMMTTTTTMVLIRARSSYGYEPTVEKTFTITARSLITATELRVRIFSL